MIIIIIRWIQLQHVTIYWCEELVASIGKFDDWAVRTATAFGVLLSVYIVSIERVRALANKCPHTDAICQNAATTSSGFHVTALLHLHLALRTSHFVLLTILQLLHCAWRLEIT